MMPAGQRNQLITFERFTAGEDALGGGGPETWAALFTSFASVRWGTSAERRDAAGEQAVQTCTFRVLANGNTRGVTAVDRIVHRGLLWDISGIALIGGPAESEIEFTATASRG
jgi:head-tail adaptor